jgi:hypothetical protein
MAKPIYSFTLNESRTPFFFLQNTFFELPHTIPMDIVSLINYKGRNCADFLKVFHKVYPDLMRSGSTLADWGYGSLDPNMRQHIEQLARIELRNASPLLLETAQQVCELFETQRSFGPFKSKLDNLLATISPHLPRPFEYYDSWHFTADSLFGNTPNEQNYLERLMAPEYDGNGNTIVPDFLLELINQNRVPLNAIPHVYRHNADVERIFRLYGAEDLLPQSPGLDEINEQEFSWQSFPLEGARLRRFTEMCLHSGMAQPMS